MTVTEVLPNRQAEGALRHRNVFCGRDLAPYASRVNRALDVIDTYLADAQSLELIAQHAPFARSFSSSFQVMDGRNTV